jgi:hypothetical protein
MSHLKHSLSGVTIFVAPIAIPSFVVWDGRSIGETSKELGQVGRADRYLGQFIDDLLGGLGQ